MPPTVEDRLRDILEAIVEIEELLTGYNLELFSADKTRRMAEIIQDHLPPLKSFVEQRIGSSN